MSGALILDDELMFPSNYLSHVDLQGKPVTVVIEDIMIEELQTRGGKSSRKPVIKMAKAKKLFVCNKTNAQALAEALNEQQARKWVGAKMVLKPTKDRFGPKMVDCIRVDVEATRRANAQTEPGSNG